MHSLNCLDVYADDAVLPQHVRFSAEGRHFVLDVAHVQRPRRREASLDKPIGALTGTTIGDASDSAAVIHFIE